MKADWILGLLIACAAIAPASARAQDENAESGPPAPLPTPIVYRNTQYGFCFRLPANWKGYKILTNEWSGVVPSEEAPGTGKIMHGPLILIRNPSWTVLDPYQDIPIMVFTQAQWREKEEHGLIDSASGVDWGPFGSNAKYVFKEPDRWLGYADARGMREVEDLMLTHPFQAPCGPIIYRNSEYGFCFLLPTDWTGYKVITEKWQAGPTGSTEAGPIEGPEILLRNPHWTEDTRWQDIPIMIFTREQWKLAENDDYAFSPGPNMPSALGSDSRYIFALPPRWFPTQPGGISGVAGVEQVLSMMTRKPFRAPCEQKTTQVGKQ
jgi:hypothetical protein